MDKFIIGNKYFGNSNAGATLDNPLDLKLKIIKNEIEVIKRTKKYITYKFNGNIDKRYVYTREEEYEYIELFYNCFIGANLIKSN